jgi:hypothetical protein
LGARLGSVCCGLGLCGLGLGGDGVFDGLDHTGFGVPLRRVSV